MAVSGRYKEAPENRYIKTLKENILGSSSEGSGRKEQIGMEELAIFGGKPVRETTICYGRQTIEQDDIDAVAECLKGDLITCGPRIKEFERRLCEYTGAKYAVIVSNGTAALHCACYAAGIGKGDEVITTPITFAASANCARYMGADVVFADIRYDTMNIDPDSIETMITDKTKAVVAVDYTGQAVEIERIREICDRHGLIFIEDAAHSIGTKYNGRQIGSLADLTTFSFHPVKTITGGEGGAILTNNEEMYKKLLLFRTHAITSENVDKKANGFWYYEQIDLGFNYRLTDFQAALLISQLGKLDRFVKRRREIANAYDEAFKDMPEIIPHTNIPESETSYHLYILRLNLNKLNCTRQQFFDAMSAEHVQPQIHYIPVYWFPYYEKLGYKRGLCPVAERVYSEIMSIPIFPLMTDKDIEDVIHAVRKVVNYYKK